MGLVANFPIAMASGMGLNAMVASLYVTGRVPSWRVAMGLIVVNGIFILVLVLLGLRESVMRAIPHDLRLAIGAGIGLFIAFIGLVNGGIVRRGVGPEPTVTYGHLASRPALVTIAGLLLSAVLIARRVKGALLIGILFATALALLTGVSSLPTTFTRPSFAAAFQADVVGALRWSFVPLLLAIMMVDFFDTLGTATAIADEAGLVDEKGEIPGLRRILIVDSAAASIGGLLGASSVTSYVESAAGVAEGARTGLHSVVVGVLFLLSAFAAPLVGVVPKEATAPALILVGFYMILQFAKIDFERLGTAIPAFITLITIPLAWSISHGIGYGFVAFVAIQVLSLRFRDVHPLMYLTAAAFTAYFVAEGMR
jgi:AGZA family xanthine/uracil permease-like MFS transporter